MREIARVVAEGRERSVVGRLCDVTEQREAEEDGRRLAVLFGTLFSSLALPLLHRDGSNLPLPSRI